MNYVDTMPDIKEKVKQVNDKLEQVKLNIRSEQGLNLKKENVQSFNFLRNLHDDIQLHFKRLEYWDKKDIRNKLDLQEKINRKMETFNAVAYDSAIKGGDVNIP